MSSPVNVTFCPSTSIRYCERVRFKGQRTQPQVGVRRLLANACMCAAIILNLFLLMPTDNNFTLSLLYLLKTMLYRAVLRVAARFVFFEFLQKAAQLFDVHSILRTSPFQGAENPTAGWRSAVACKRLHVRRNYLKSLFIDADR